MGYAKKKVRIALLLALIISSITYIVAKVHKNTSNNVASSESTVIAIENLVGGVPIGEIYGNMQVSQSFLATKNNLNGFGLRFATYIRTNYCILKVELIDITKGNEIVFSELVDGETLTDNTFRDFTFDKLTDSKDHMYNIVVSAIETSPGNAVTMYLTLEDTYLNGTFAINGEECNGDTHFKVYFEDEDMIRQNKFLIFLSVIVTILFVSNIVFNFNVLIKKFGAIFYFTITIILIFILSAFITIRLDNEMAKVEVVLNYKATAFLGISIIALVLAEKKLQYGIWLKEKIDKELQQIYSLCEKQEGKKMVLHLLTIFFNIVFLVYAVIFLSFCWMNKCAITMFIFGTLAIVLNILDQVFIKNRGPACIFLSTSLILGFIMAYCFPATTFTCYDDVIHYERAVIVRNTLFDRSYTNADGAMTASSYTIEDYIYNLDIVSKVLNDDSRELLYSVSSFKIYNFLAYFPTAAIMAFSDWVGGDFFGMVVAAKFINSVLYTLLVYYALKRLKSGIYLLASISLMPLMLYLSAQFTYDYWVNAFLIFGFAYFVSEMQQPEHVVTFKDCAIMIGSVILGCGPKEIYCFMILLFLVMGRDRFQSEKSYKRYCATCVFVTVLIMLSFILPFISNAGGATDFRGGSGVNAKEQLLFILTNPLRYIKILLKYMADFVSLNTFMNWSGMFGYMGTAKTFFVTVYTFIIGFCVFTDKDICDQPFMALKVRTVTFAICFIQVALICTALYISYTPVALETINGVQYRYLFPILFPFLYSIGTPKIKNEIKQSNKNIIVFGGMSMMVLASVFFVYIVRLF